MRLALTDEQMLTRAAAGDAHAQREAKSEEITTAKARLELLTGEFAALSDEFAKATL